ncbi:endonuclease domain-containing protein [Kluyvera genomosp. 1]|uniref:endonuclease domain-containing protein n=1 Tax=Kluyvera genomosp. 1 TaxID=2774053 RepID=UPI00068A738B|nr:endonuclease domain-containing protein [Kluyvera genomosp. 1]
MESKYDFAQQLRRQLTPQERRLWYLLRNRRFAHFKFRRQHPVGPYFLDFACCRVHLAVELDGGQHDARAGYDARRTAWLTLHGWRVLRFWNNELIENEEAVLARILEALVSQAPSPRPSPWKGEGE